MILHFDFNPLYMALAMAPVGIVGAALGLGGTLLGGLFSRKSAEEKRAQRAQTALASSQAKLARGRAQRESALFAQAQPIAGQLIPQLQALLTGDREILTQRFAPSLERLAGQRQTAAQRIRESGPGSGATVQAQLELEREQFRQQNALLSAAPQEAQAGLTQLLTLLLGGATQAGQGATSAAAASSAASESILASEGRNRLLGQQFFTTLAQGAEDFGRSLFKPKTPGAFPGGTGTGGDIGFQTPGAAPITTALPAGPGIPPNLLRQLLEGLN